MFRGLRSPSSFPKALFLSPLPSFSEVSSSDSRSPVVLHFWFSTSVDTLPARGRGAATFFWKEGVGIFPPPPPQKIQDRQAGK